MGNELTTIDAVALEGLLAKGDLSAFTPAQRVQYYRSTCQSLGLNPLTRPFDYIALNGKITLYAKRDCTDQLRQLRGISITTCRTRSEGDLFIAEVEARDAAGRSDSDIGAVNIKGLFGDALANASMKAITKAKRRVTLSLSGLGFSDETEIETIPSARRVDVAETGEIVNARPVIDLDRAKKLFSDASEYDPADEPALAATTEKICSEGQRKRIYAISKARGFSDDKLKLAMGVEFGVEHSRDLTMKQASAFMTNIESGKYDA